MDKTMVQSKVDKYNDNLELIEQARSGDKVALDKITEINLPLVSSICKKFLNRGYEYDDIFQIGCIGLIKAVNNFDAKFNVRFSTYAVPMIMGEIKRFLRDDGMIKVSRSLKSTAKEIHYAKEELCNKLGKEPTLEELSEYTKISKEDIIFALESSVGPQYLYDTIHQDDGSPVLLIDKLSDNYQESDNLIDKIALKDLLYSLDEKSRQVIMLRYFKDKTQVQVAKVLGISQVQVSRIEKRVLLKLKEKLTS